MFDSVVSIWTMTLTACATLGGIHLLLWLKDRRAHASLAFVGLIVGVAGIALFEMRMMGAGSPEQFAILQRNTHIPVTVLTLSLVAMVRLMFGPRHAWIGVLAIGFRLAALLVNYLVPGSVNFVEISALRQVEFLGSLVAVPIGTTSAWSRVPEFSNLLMLVYVVAAASAHARLGPEQRRRAWTIGGSLVVFVLVAAGLAISVSHGLLHLPYTISLPALGVVVVMAYEVSRDLAGARQLAQELHESQKRNELAASSAGVGLYSWQAGGQELWANATAREMHGAGDARLADMAGLLERVHPEDRDLVRLSLLDAVEANSEFRVTYRVGSTTAPWRWIEARGAFEHDPPGRTRALHGVCIDVSERRAAEERFQRVVEAAPNAMLLVDADGRITLANRQAEIMFGCAARELLGRQVDDFAASVTAATHRAHRQSFAADPQARRMSPGRELQARRADGSEFVAEVGLSPIQTRDGPQVLASIVDLTLRRQNEQELQRLRDQTFSAARISLAGQLASTLAHEINQPLGAILRNAEAASMMLEAGNADQAELAAIVSDIRGDDQRAGAIIEHMRTLLRRRQPELHAVPLDQLVATVLALVRHDVVERRVVLSAQIPRDVKPVRGDAVLLQQVLLNLVFNSLDALEQVPPDSRRLVISARGLADGKVEVVVRDTGPGLPPEVLKRIFEPFHTTKANGMGMGLAICRSLVESMDGSIDANNQIDGGAAFRIVLPAAAETVTA